MKRIEGQPDHCAESDRVGPYLAGQLDEAAADAFESHYFGCDLCDAELQRAVEIRAGFSASPKRRTAIPAWLAAAASIAAIGLSAFWLWPDPTRIDPVRGVASVLAVVDQSTPTVLAVDWDDVPGADVYEVTLLGVDGALLLRREEAASELSVPRAGIGPAADGKSFWRIVARDELRRVLAESKPTPTDSSGSPATP